MATIEKRTIGNGQTTYRVKVRLKGYPVQTASFERITDARKWAGQTEAAIREGRHFKTVEAKRHTLGDLVERYLKHVLPLKSKSAVVLATQKSQLEWWREQLGAHTLADVTPAMIAEQRDILASGLLKNGERRSPATVNRYLAALSHAFTVTVKEWGWMQENPISKVTRLKEPRGRVRFLSDDERTSLLDACKKSNAPYLYTIVVLALSTGARKMEILSLRWRDVNPSRKTIILHETKNGERRVLPLQGYALELVKALRTDTPEEDDFLFPSGKKKQPIDIRTAWENAMQEAELHDFRFHDLRHSAASYLAMNGASLAEIAEVLGHKTLQMVKRYAHLSEAHTSRVVAAMNERIFG